MDTQAHHCHHNGAGEERIFRDGQSLLSRAHVVWLFHVNLLYCFVGLVLAFVSALFKKASADKPEAHLLPTSAKRACPGEQELRLRRESTESDTSSELCGTQSSQSIKNEGYFFQQAPFSWLCEHFRDGNLPQEYMEAVLKRVPITSHIANEVKSEICELREKVEPDFHKFYPYVIISYSTGYREDYDRVDCAGPGLMVVAALINFLFENGYECFSDIMTPAGIDWNQFFLRLKRAKVVVMLVCRKSLRSVHCLREMATAVDCRIPIIPPRLDETSASGKGEGITRDEEAMWPDEELERYAKGNQDFLAEGGRLSNGLSIDSKLSSSARALRWQPPSSSPTQAEGPC